MQTYSKPIPGLSAIQSSTFIELFRDYEQGLIQPGTTIKWCGSISAQLRTLGSGLS